MNYHPLLLAALIIAILEVLLLTALSVKQFADFIKISTISKKTKFFRAAVRILFTANFAFSIIRVLTLIDSEVNTVIFIITVVFCMLNAFLVIRDMESISDILETATESDEINAVRK